MDRETFGRFIADMRRNAGMTQQALADQLHVTNTAVSKWERGLCYPDVTLLEDFAFALGLTLTELISCEKTAEKNAEAPCMEGNMASLLDIANESHCRQRRKTLRSILLVLSVAILSVVLAYLCITFVRIYTGCAMYIGSQVKEEGNFVYMDLGDELLCLLCEDQKMFDAVISGDAQQYYTIGYQWNYITRQGVLKRCEVNNLILGTDVDIVGSIIGVGSMLGVDCVCKRLVAIYSDPCREGCYLYTLEYFFKGTGHQYFPSNQTETHILTIKDCRGAA